MRGSEREGGRVDLRSTIFNRKTRKTSCSPGELWMVGARMDLIRNKYETCIPALSGMIEFCNRDTYFRVSL